MHERQAVSRHVEHSLRERLGPGFNRDRANLVRAICRSAETIYDGLAAIDSVKGMQTQIEVRYLRTRERRDPVGGGPRLRLQIERRCGGVARRFADRRHRKTTGVRNVSTMLGRPSRLDGRHRQAGQTRLEPPPACDACTHGDIKPS
jgi:hypothetical protein